MNDDKRIDETLSKWIGEEFQRLGLQLSELCDDPATEP